MVIKGIKGTKVLVEIGNEADQSIMVIWLDKEMLRQYGIETKGLKIGMKFDPKDYMPFNN